MRVIKLLILAAAFLSAQSDPLVDGLRQFDKGDYHAAESSLSKAGNDPRARGFLALARAALGRCPDAVGELQLQFDKADDKELSRLAGLGLARCRAAISTDAALPVLAQLRSRFPDDADVLYESARVYMRAWNEVVYAMFQKTPSSFRVNQMSAEVFETQSNYRQAIAEYQNAIAKSPRALNLHFRLGRALLMDSHEPRTLDQALKEFRSELELNPSDAAAEYQVGQVLVAQQKQQEARPHYEMALAFTPDFAEALIALARIDLSLRDYPGAIARLERAVQLRPASESAHYSLMLAYRNAGRLTDAKREQAELEKITKPPEGEFTNFLKKLGNKPSTEKPPQP